MIDVDRGGGEVTMFWKLFPNMDDGWGRADLTDEEGVWTTELRDKIYALHKPGVAEDFPVLDLTMDGRPMRHYVGGTRRNDLASSALRAVVEPLLAPDDEVQWLPADLRLTPGARPERWWFVNPLRVLPLHREASSYGGLTPVAVAVIDGARVEGRRIFKLPYGYPPVVHQVIRDAVEDAGLDAGIDWLPVDVV